MGLSALLAYGALAMLVFLVTLDLTDPGEAPVKTKTCPQKDCKQCPRPLDCPSDDAAKCVPCFASVCGKCPDPDCGPGKSTTPTPSPGHCNLCSPKPGNCPSTVKRERKAAAAKNLRVVVSLSSTPCKLWTEKLHEVLNKIKQQKFPPHAIYLNIAETGRRDGLKYILPPWIAEDPDIIVLKVREDLGPVMKILPTLVKETGPETRIITIDDDWNYDLYMIQSLVEWSLEMPDAALSFVNGYNVSCWIDDILECDPKYGKYPIMTQPPSDDACQEAWKKQYGDHGCAAAVTEKPLPVHVIQGVGGCIYPRSLFHTAVFDIESSKWPTDHCFFNDDIYLSGRLAQAGTPRYVIPQFVQPPDAVFRDIKEPVFYDGTPLELAKFSLPPFSKPAPKEADLPFDRSKCGGELHGGDDFMDHNRECSRQFSDYWEGKRLKPLNFEEPDFVVLHDRQ